MTRQLVVLASGSGSNLQAILDACANRQLDAEVTAVISDKPDAYALERAARARVPAVVVERHQGELRALYDARLREAAAAHQPDWVVLAGFMRLLTHHFLDGFPSRVINLHPALPGEFPGLHAIERAFAEWTSGSRTETGVMVHLVPDEGVDDGPVLAHEAIAFHPGETLGTFATRLHALEHRLLVDTLITLTRSAPHEP
jgi:phosphoribosylglycinamide formyltransferase 1